MWTGSTRTNSGRMGNTSGARFLCAVDADPMDAPLLRRADQFSTEQKTDLQVVPPYLLLSRFRPARSLLPFVVFCWIPPSNGSRIYNPKQLPTLTSSCGSGRWRTSYEMLRLRRKRT